ncbi:MAG: hypothetical protein QM473_09745 [Acidobacteriota bacterium]|nr:hypothetical protein [Acidobacteriota bacterium]
MRTCCFLAIAVAVLLSPANSFALDDATRDAILRAGNADDDAVRLAILKELQQKPDLDAALKEDLPKIVSFIENWVDGKNLSFFAGPIYKTRDYDFGIAPESPLYPLTYIYRGRGVFAACIQSGNIWSYYDRRAEWFATAREFFEKYHAAFPENRIARMYLGEGIPWEKTWPAVESAPQWAVDQRAGLEAIADIVEWWIDNRQQANGAFGGGWGDDCEMWRWWVPVMIAFEDRKITDAQAKFSEAVMGQDYMKGGFMTKMTDVEHSAEDSTDTILPMMHLAPDDEIWRGRALRLAELMRDLWTGRNERGFLQFKSTYFTVDKVHEDPQKACDTPYHVRAIQPALLYWQRTGDPQLTALFSDWMDTWVDATAREENGKPAGIIPAALHWPEGTVGGISPNWWDPRNHNEPTLYEWPSSMGAFMDAMLLTYHMTDDEKYLAPIRSMARIRLDYLQSGRPAGDPGTLNWCAARMGFIGGTMAKYRAITGDPQFDGLLAGGGSAYQGFLLTGDRKPLEAALEGNAKAFAYNFPRYTSEVRWTDRVLRFPAVFTGKVKLAEPNFEVHQPAPDLLYSTATGDPGALGYFQMNAVRWLTKPREIAALVTAAGSDRFSAELFHFGEAPRPMAAEFYLLGPGEYRLSVRRAGNEQPLETVPFTVEGARAQAAFTLPARELCVVEVRSEPGGAP